MRLGDKMKQVLKIGAIFLVFFNLSTCGMANSQIITKTIQGSEILARTGTTVSVNIARLESFKKYLFSPLIIRDCIESIPESGVSPWVSRSWYSLITHVIQEYIFAAGNQDLAIGFLWYYVHKDPISYDVINFLIQKCHDYNFLSDDYGLSSEKHSV